MTPEELRELLERPESDVLEFKARLPNARVTARLISAFANTRGGVLVVGVDEQSEIIGIHDSAHTLRILEEAERSVLPPVHVKSEIAKLNGKEILLATIPRGVQSPYFAENRAFQRMGGAVVPLGSDAIYESIRERAESSEDLLVEVKELAARIEQLNAELLAGRSWRSKIVDMVVGGIIGALISIVLALLLEV